MIATKSRLEKAGMIKRTKNGIMLDTSLKKISKQLDKEIHLIHRQQARIEDKNSRLAEFTSEIREEVLKLDDLLINVLDTARAIGAIAEVTPSRTIEIHGTDDLRKKRK